MRLKKKKMNKFPLVIFVRSTLWEQKNGNVPKKNVGLLFFFVATSRNDVIFAVATKKTPTYGTFHAFQITVQNLPLRTKCAQGGPNKSNCHDGRSSSRRRALRLYQTCILLPDHLLLCVDY